MLKKGKNKWNNLNKSHQLEFLSLVPLADAQVVLLCASPAPSSAWQVNKTTSVTKHNIWINFFLHVEFKLLIFFWYIVFIIIFTFALLLCPK